MQIQSLQPLDTKRIDDAFVCLNNLLNKKNTNEMKKAVEIYETRIEKTKQALQENLLPTTDELMKSLEDLLSLIRFLNINGQVGTADSICTVLTKACQLYLLSFDIFEQNLTVTLKEQQQLVLGFSHQKIRDLITNNLTRLSIPYQEITDSNTGPTQQKPQKFYLHIDTKGFEDFLFIFFKGDYRYAYNQIHLEELVGDEVTNVHYEYYDTLTSELPSVVDPEIFNQSLGPLTASDSYRDFFPATEPVSDTNSKKAGEDKPNPPAPHVVPDAIQKGWNRIWNKKDLTNDELEAENRKSPCISKHPF